MNSTKTQEKKMQKYAIVTSVQENYAAHNENWDGKETYWKTSQVQHILYMQSLKQKHVL